MKLIANKVILIQTLLIAIIVTGCVSTTLFRTYPTRADVYINGEKKGRTPYYYSDRKIIASSTPVTFTKTGYNDLNIKLTRDEELDVGPLIGGLFLIVPFLWVTKYDSLHVYRLERDLSYLQFSSTISIPPDSSKNIDRNIPVKNDTIPEFTEVTNQVVDKPEKIIPDENDTLEYYDFNSSQQPLPKTTSSHFGFGGGFCLPGSVWSMRYTFISSVRWGGSIRFSSNIFKSNDVPADYYDDGNRVFAPKDYINSFAFNIVRSFDSPKKSRLYGIEFGPSWDIYREAQFKLNSSYDPYWGFLSDKYYKSHSRANLLGLSVRAKMEFIFSKFSGLEIAAFTNINSKKPIIGFEVDLILGRMGYTK